MGARPGRRRGYRGARVPREEGFQVPPRPILPAPCAVARCPPSPQHAWEKSSLHESLGGWVKGRGAGAGGRFAVCAR